MTVGEFLEQLGRVNAASRVVVILDGEELGIVSAYVDPEDSAALIVEIERGNADLSSWTAPQ